MTRKRKQTNAAALREVMARHGLTYANVAELCSVSSKTVESWLATATGSNFRPMHDRYLELIRLKMTATRRRN